ncbi:hypothetical protein HPB47_028104 [Ixodes persulcatus]|uniref:Uncharacterized protein n=1 Tax=Ixodes persulcatus TaxID=34615 RepID=A0AC60PU71_IXOPE|nr:hypothetical protein HPB47_028104 [Ixodes persulcatus]
MRSGSSLNTFLVSHRELYASTPSFSVLTLQAGPTDVIDLSEVLSLGQFQMSHFWMATLASSAAAQRLKAVKELNVKGKKCLIVDPNSKDVKIKLLWLPLHLEDQKIAESLEPCETARSVTRKNYATVLRGPLIEPDANSELLIDITEVVDASGEVLSSQKRPRDPVPPSSDDSKATTDKELSESQASATTQVVVTACQETKPEDTQETFKVPRQTPDATDDHTSSDCKEDPPTEMDTTVSTKDANDSKRKKVVSPGTVASKRKSTLSR